VTARAATKIPWPEGKDFAFTIFDDTERGSVENNRAIYGLLAECGLRTTKSVWPVEGPGQPDIPGPTCDEPVYRALCLELQAQGFEMALHNATYHTADRALTQRAFDRFREIFGHDPVSMANHSTNREGIYWGAARLSGWRRWAYLLVQRGQKFRGHIEGDPLFWGDLCRDRVRYVRNFTFGDLNTLAMCPQMPYHDPARPFVNLWFAGSDATHVEAWRRKVTEAALDRLAAERGACLIYTHFGKRFHRDGVLDRRFEETIRHLGRMNGWFVPVSTLLDFLAGQQGEHKVITPRERAALENRWCLDQLSNLRHRF
jgi:hypothetical protein